MLYCDYVFCFTMRKLPNAKDSKRRKSFSYYRCSDCMYESDRWYNVLRHEYRIHSTSSEPNYCCDQIFKTKGEFYLHCEENHPNSRVTNSTSRYKYKILPKNMIHGSPNARIVMALPQKSPENRYMLRSRVPINYCEDDTKITFLKTASPKSPESADKSETDAQTDQSANLEQSSDYGTNNSNSTTFDSTKENDETKLLYLEQFNEWEALNHQNLLGNTIDKFSNDSIESFPSEFSKNGKTTAGFGENSMIDVSKTLIDSNVNSTELQNDEENLNSDKSSDLNNLSMHPEKSFDSKQSKMIKLEDMNTSSENELKENLNSDKSSDLNNLSMHPEKSFDSKQSKMIKLEDMNTSSENELKENLNSDKSSDLNNLSMHPEKSFDSKQSKMIKLEDMSTSSENELKENYCSLLSSSPCKLPPKKRILLSLGYSNRKNINREAIDEHLHLPNPLKVEQTPLRKKHRLSKKIKCRKLRKRINLSECSSASSDAENVPPTGANPRKQKIPSLKVDFRSDGIFTWDEITRRMREHVLLINFDSFQASP